MTTVADLADSFSEILEDSSESPYIAIGALLKACTRQLHSHSAKVVLESAKLAWESRTVVVAGYSQDIDNPERNERLFWMLQNDLVSLAKQHEGIEQ